MTSSTRTGNDVAIVGGGLAGPLLAVYLARRGHQVTLYERRPDPRKTQLDAGRSINLALSVRGITALRGVGLDTEVLKSVLPMYGRVLHPKVGDTSFVSYSADGKRAINSVSRPGLSIALLDTAEAEPNVRIRFGATVKRVDDKTNQLVVAVAPEPESATQSERGSAGAAQEVVGHEIIIGTDGAFSAVRERLVHTAGTDYRQDYLPWVYKELEIPAGADGKHRLNPEALHIWPRRDSMMIALPNLDGSFTATLFWPFEGPHGFAGLDTPNAIKTHFNAHYGGVSDLIPDLAEQFVANPVGSLMTVRMWPWVLNGRIALLGDAAHAIVPFYGQGMNCSFEDVVELNRCLEEFNEDWPAALDAYQKRRKPNADAIAELALENFVEMRDKVSSPIFRATREAEHSLERRFPGKYLSLYEVVSFTEIPYSEAKKAGGLNPASMSAFVSALVKKSERSL